MNEIVTQTWSRYAHLSTAVMDAPGDDADVTEVADDTPKAELKRPLDASLVPRQRHEPTS